MHVSDPILYYIFKSNKNLNVKNEDLIGSVENMLVNEKIFEIRYSHFYQGDIYNEKLFNKLKLENLNSI